MSNLTLPHFALRITLIYAVLSALWILSPDPRCSDVAVVCSSEVP